MPQKNQEANSGKKQSGCGCGCMVSDDKKAGKPQAAIEQTKQ